MAAVGAIVGDVGSAWTRIGHAGDDVPGAFFPSVLGQLGGSGKSARWAVTAEELHHHRGVELNHPVQDGIVQDWDGVEQLWSRGFQMLSGGKAAKQDAPIEHPVLLAESAWATPQAREQYAELMFERFGVPGLFISKNPVLACFANARSSGLVLDIGGSVTSAVPVHDGQLVAKAVKRSALAGSALSRELADAIEADGEYRGGATHGSDAEDDSTAGGGQRSRAKGAAGSGGYALHPRCTLAKTRGRDGTHPILPQGELDKIHQTYLTWARLELSDEIKRTHCHVHVSELGGSGGDGAVVPKLPFELPDGTIVHVGAERFQVNPLLPQLPRTLRCLRRRVRCPPPPPLATTAAHSASIGSHFALRPSVNPSSWPQVPELLFEPGVGRFAAVSSLPKLLCDAALDCELDIRKELFASVIVTGGGSAIRGLEARLSKGVIEMAPPVLKVKTLAAPAKERRLGAWLGGSILGSLGSCHDMWVSKAEYAESGSAIIEKKCP